MTKVLYILLFTFFLSLSLYIRPQTVEASIIISEVYPAPTSGENEWIELYNTESIPFDLSSFYLQDELSTPSTLYTFSENDLIEAQTYFVVELSSQKLNNSAEGLKLFNSGGSIIDSTSYTSSETGKSWNRASADTAELYLASPTKGIKNAEVPPSPVPSPSPIPSMVPSPTPSIPSPTPEVLSNKILKNIHFTSFLPCPDAGAQEWIELENKNEQEVVLTNWLVEDKDGNTKKVSGRIAAQSKVKLGWSGYLLNNAGDTFSVKNSPEILIAAAEYGECEKNVPFIKSGDSWILQGEVHTDTVNTHSSVIEEMNTISVSASNSADQEKNLPTKSSFIVPIHPSEINTTSAVQSIPEPTLLANPSVKISKEGVISVIMGGIVISLSSIWRVYEVLSLHST